MRDRFLTCTEPGCHELVRQGRCAAHARRIEQRRGSASSRGYGQAWKQFKPRFKAQLIALGIAPVCGARMPGAPETMDSQCRAEGRLNARRLHLDHTPPLTPSERLDRCAVCDPLRVQYLCESCHNAKTARENHFLTAREGYTPVEIL
jgi:hypothetical protein